MELLFKVLILLNIKNIILLSDNHKYLASFNICLIPYLCFNTFLTSFYAFKFYNYKIIRFISSFYIVRSALNY